MEKLILRDRRDYATRHRHPWIFSGAVQSVTGSPVVGETVEVVDASGETLGYGSWSPASQIRVRMLSFDKAAVPDAEFVKGLVAAAVGRRAGFFVDGRTNAFRLVHGESDGIPGVVADYYDGWVVAQFASAGAEFWKGAVVDALMQYVPFCKGVYNRSDVDSRAREGLRDGDVPAADETGPLAGGEPPELIEIFEDGVKYLVDVRKGHKTGFYLDQRDARAAVARCANGAEMLNCFAYTGGFGLAARAAGAASVVQLDISRQALDLAKKNADLDHLCGTTFEYVAADVFKHLRLYRDQGRSFDMIVLDPPKFADTKGQLMRAMRGYKDINLLAMKLLKPNGVLATFSCSGAMSPEMFETVCREAAFDARRSFQILERTSQAPDHPVSLSFPEGLYLKGLLLRAV
jgi:23S rRNA (cytosine1962-C5)-methyltransferase